MPRTDRAQRFLIDPLAVTRDPVRRAMSPTARGIYDTLWLESWCEKEPGVLPADDVILAGLAQVSMPEWLKYRDDVSTGFMLERRLTGDVWMCSAVVRTKGLQDTRREAWRERQRRHREKGRDTA